ncbi:MAG: DNA-3-methyladenine glycosylase [Opitutales bacterium]|nr:DNA-3-methyladenine glycosylase [Opitutales bacterium]
MGDALPQSFYERESFVVARELLGKRLVHELEGESISGLITEVEVYDGSDDKASHAHMGLTNRNAPMFGEPGVWYVYLCYGVHWMLNIVTRERGYPAALLIRGIDVAQGPGRLTKYLQITKQQNGTKSFGDASLYVEKDGIVPVASDIRKTPRIGISYAGEPWTSALCRFVWDFDK